MRGGCREAFPVRGSVATFSADLGGSSKYTNENFVSRTWRKVSREQHLIASQSILRHRLTSRIRRLASDRVVER